MQLFKSTRPLVWGDLDLPLLGVSSDWSGAQLQPPAGFCIAADGENLWFAASRGATAHSHPDSTTGTFTPELWKYDCAELFIADPETGAYLEFNIAPNGGWWASRFTKIRAIDPEQPDFKSAVSVHAQDSDADMWLVALSIPLAFLKKHINFRLGNTANVAFILNSPEQTFHTANKLSGIIPDFHQPTKFPKLIPCEFPPG